ncbi:Eco57I restriction-modification methylase domain-containing protein [Actinomadura rupiterrae]|uniref:Eco57I restriction-modification methylase domain-containing protein n=1 Tax=Actinomadura rupiterrae TaxID=559627 RepID=UPI0020A30AA5|nr:methyltransferase domain-containing protein [Actinomadura rupiterrae]MCP2342985.1 SAM-dependent methyltransferase [Actinomadura rupiterrae]
MKTNDSPAWLVNVCLSLGARDVAGWSPEETALVNAYVGDVEVSTSELARVRQAIQAGGDPLGEAFSQWRSPEARRPLGQTYTPGAIIDAMVEWAADQGIPERVVDPGCGSGRYITAAARRFPKAELLAIDIDPLATLMTRAALAASGTTKNVSVILGDYRSLKKESRIGRSLYIGNPPYVRHHQIDSEWKRWLANEAKACGLRASALAGLHVYFFLATARQASDGDYGAFITSAEWLDVNYGSLIRQLLLTQLGGKSIHVIEPEAMPFADAATTGAITCFEVGKRHPHFTLRRVEDVENLDHLQGGTEVHRERLAEANRWSVLTRVTPKLPEGYVELGELARVHRGTATGANAIWVTDISDDRIPKDLLAPAVTKARELFAAGDRLVTTEHLRRIIDLPEDLDTLDPNAKKAVEKFLSFAEARGVREGYLASKRRVWWSLGVRKAAPILASYMARRPPAFVLNDANASHLNIAHGLYPRLELNSVALERLAAHLRTAVTQAQGRTYAGGLTKFEPKEMERIPVPSLEVLLEAG